MSNQEFEIKWQNVQSLPPRSYTCGHCDHRVGPNLGFVAWFVPRDKFQSSEEIFYIYICSYCNQPSYFQNIKESFQVPGPSFGASVTHLPPNIAAVYNEARRCMTSSAYTAAVFMCRKLLMHIAVAKGAEENKTFQYYVNYLDSNNHIPLGSRSWVDHIRTKGNEASHELEIKSKADAEDLISFSEMLLKIIYEYPGRISSSS